tara:strand:+ start:31 stop:372 length:342 start_codon:yes stop_codon:yes gene_type:complete
MSFTNLNECRNGVVMARASSWITLSGATDTCSEVIVMGPTNGVWISDGGGTGRDTGSGGADPQTASQFFVPANTHFTFRGITNAADLSAKSGSGNVDVYYRTQYYGSLTPVTG